MKHARTNTFSNRNSGATQNNIDAETQAKTGFILGEDEDYEMDSVQISGRGSQIDPVRCLQNIFRKHEYKQRRPGVNQIAEKYKNQAKSQHGHRRRNSRIAGTANTFDFAGPAQGNNNIILARG